MSADVEMGIEMIKKRDPFLAEYFNFLFREIEMMLKNTILVMGYCVGTAAGLEERENIKSK